MTSIGLICAMLITVITGFTAAQTSCILHWTAAVWHLIRRMSTHKRWVPLCSVLRTSSVYRVGNIAMGLSAITTTQTKNHYHLWILVSLASVLKKACGIINGMVWCSRDQYPTQHITFQGWSSQPITPLVQKPGVNQIKLQPSYDTKKLNNSYTRNYMYTSRTNTNETD